MRRQTIAASEPVPMLPKNARREGVHAMAVSKEQCAESVRLHLYQRGSTVVTRSEILIG